MSRIDRFEQFMKRHPLWVSAFLVGWSISQVLYTKHFEKRSN